MLGIAALITSYACAKGPKQAQDAQALQPDQQTDSSVKTAEQIQNMEREQSRADASTEARNPAPVKTPPLPVKPGSGLQILLTLGRDSSTFPEDFKIGPLSGVMNLSGDDAGAGAAAGSFLSDLTKGKISSELLAQEAAAGLPASLKHHLSEGSVPSSYRLGRPKKLPGGEIAFNVRLFKGEGSAEGEIFLVQNDRHWGVSDFQLSLSQLAEIRQKPDEKFFPNSYRWLLGE